MDEKPCARTASAARGLVALLLCAMGALACAFLAAQPQTANADTGTQKVYRLYNQWSGEHLYTTKSSELVGNTVNHWTYEGIGWNAPTQSDTPVYRIYNQWSHEHLYTANENEYKTLVAQGWNDEGVLCQSIGEGGIPVYRLYNRWNPEISSHHYTTSANERDTLQRQGWRYEDVQWYAATPVDQDLYLGSFFVDVPGGAGFETVLAASRDGVNFTKISTPTKKDQTPFHDPSIMYNENDGYFYLLANANKADDRFWPVISYSKDLKTWTTPEGDALVKNLDGSDYNGIPMESNPFGMATFDTVAPEWFIDDDGSIYIIFSAGYYGGLHNDYENDRMKAYAVKVEIQHNGIDPNKISWAGMPWPQDIKFGYGRAFELRGLDPSDNYIDGSVYKENGKYYLIVKKDGVNNQIYESTSLTGTWHRVNTGLALGNEGPSLTKMDGAYMLYTDLIPTYPDHFGQTGITVSLSGGLGSSFSDPVPVTCAGAHLRHGTVLKLEGAAKKVGETFVRGSGV